MKLFSYITVASLLLSASFTACQDDFEDVENKVFDTSALTPTTVLIDGMANESVQTFTFNMALPQATDVTVTYGADFSKVEEYNTIYGQKAIALPAENFTIDEPTCTFIKGAVKSTAAQVTIKDINNLDRDIVYCLPLTVVDTQVPVLESERTRFIIVRGAALINVVANINENYCTLVSPTNATGLNGLSEMTMQCMVKIDEFGKLISTIMGIEGNFLLRIGDAGVPENQLQLATSNGNVTDASWQFKTGEWIMVAFTFNSANGESTLWLNGAKKATLYSNYRNNVNWGSNNFYVGKSYADDRYLDGCITEARVWNRILTDAELANTMQYYSVPTDSEGLVAYWKFNEGAGAAIKDYANGYDLICNTAPTWVEVSLPEE